jgi:hypothetical protein
LLPITFLLHHQLRHNIELVLHSQSLLDLLLMHLLLYLP